MKTILTLVVLLIHSVVLRAAGTNDYPVIDIHTHVFNARYLPVEGIVQSHYVPKIVARGIRKLVVGGTRVADLSPGSKKKNLWRLSQLESVDDATRLNAVGLDDTQNTGKDLLRNSAAADLTAAERTALAEFAGVTNFSSKINSIMSDPDVPPRAPSIDEDILTRVLLRSRLLREEYEPRGGSQTDRDKNYLRFIRFLMNDEITIVHALKNDFPEVDLFIHHMMDMEKPYNDKPAFAFDEQIRRMKTLQDLFPGELLTFVAFDPFRRKDALDSAIAGLKHGAIGVKFYPPSGYRASSNAFPGKPTGIFAPVEQWESRYKGWTSNDLDKVNERFFAYCASNDVPIFTHCTPHGFEAFEGAGLSCDPSAWERVLTNHPKLRVCFGHGGGADGWFDGSSWPTTNRFFSEQVYALCTKYENVFCEVAYWDEIMGNDTEAFRKKFKALMTKPALPGEYAFADKVMYGSDWHMIVALNDRREYLHKFQELFKDAELGPEYGHKFFARNAARFLRLERVAESNKLTRDQREALKKLLARL